MDKDRDLDEEQQRRAPAIFNHEQAHAYGVKYSSGSTVWQRQLSKGMPSNPSGIETFRKKEH